MPKPLHQIGATVDHVSPGRVRHKRPGIEEHHVPQRQAPALIEREAHFRLQVGVFDRGYALHQVGIQVLHIAFAHLRVRRVRHGRVQVLPARGHAFAHHLIKLLKAVVADTGVAVRGDVGRVNGPHRGFQRQTARHGRRAFGSVASDAVTQLGNILAALGLRGLGGGANCRGRLIGAGCKGTHQRQTGYGQTREG